MMSKAPFPPARLFRYSPARPYPATMPFLPQPPFARLAHSPNRPPIWTMTKRFSTLNGEEVWARSKRILSRRKDFKEWESLGLDHEQILSRGIWYDKLNGRRILRNGKLESAKAAARRIEKRRFFTVVAGTVGLLMGYVSYKDRQSQNVGDVGPECSGREHSSNDSLGPGQSGLDTRLRAVSLGTPAQNHSSSEDRLRQRYQSQAQMVQGFISESPGVK